MSKTDEKEEEEKKKMSDNKALKSSSEDTEEYELSSEYSSDDELGPEDEEWLKKAEEFDKKNVQKFVDETVRVKTLKRKEREEEEASLAPWQKNSEFHNPNLRHKRMKMLEPPPISEPVMKQLEDIKKRISDFLHAVLPKDKQALANELEGIPIYSTRVGNQVIEGMVQKFNKNIVGCSYVRRLMKIPINLLMMKAGLTIQEIQGGKDTMEKFTDLLLEACDILKTHKIK